MPCQYTSLRRLPTTWNRFGGLGKYIEISVCKMVKFYCEINYCNYPDPLCYVENLLIIGGYKDDFNGLRDSLIYA